MANDPTGRAEEDAAHAPDGEARMQRARELAREVEALLAEAEDALPAPRAYGARLAKALATSLVEELDPDAQSERRPSVRVQVA